LRKIDDCLYVGEDILASVLRLASQNANLFLSSFLLGNISRDL
jgi:hypothetical protein